MSKYTYIINKKGQERIGEYITKILAPKSIEPAQRDWASSIVIAAKKYGSCRLCVNNRKLNEVNIPNSYNIKRMNDCIDVNGVSNVYYALDANWGYWKMPIVEESLDKTTFVIHRGTLR